MKNKKLGIILVIVGVSLGLIMFGLTMQLEKITAQLCDCSHSSDKMLVATHMGIGVVFSIISLGIYLLLFEKSELAILKRLEDEKNKRLDKEKFEILLSGMDEYEQTTLRAIKEQKGITQNTLRLRTDMSSAKLRLVLTELEKRGLIKKVTKGRTFSIFLKKDY